MRFVIIGHVKHKREGERYFAYAPYVREMNVWLKHVDEVEIVAPIGDDNISSIDAPLYHPNIVFNAIPSIEFTSMAAALKSLLVIPLILIKIYRASSRADHIHIRCPGNVGLLGCIVQLFFRKKRKTAKYAGNWDPNSKQPLSYRIQKKILKSTVLTKNMKALVYGDFKDDSKNIKPFFTASYHESEIEKPKTRDYNQTLKFLFVGGLVEGKRPLLSLQIVDKLIKKGIKSEMDFYGEGLELIKLQQYVEANGLKNVVRFMGNQSKESIKKALREAHFLMLPSKSEGWPKAIVEAMFFGVIPIVTKISCVPFMLDDGKRGILIDSDFNNAVAEIMNNLEPEHLIKLSDNAVTWSQGYTLDAFEREIKKLLLE